jgi:hypothetical protein
MNSTAVNNSDSRFEPDRLRARIMRVLIVVL